MMHFVSFAVFAALNVMPAQAQAESDAGNAGTSEVDQPTPEDLEQAAAEAGKKRELLAFNGTVSRFVDRMREFNSDARGIIQAREKQERDALLDGYRGPLAELRTEEVALRDTAIGRLENFLVRYPQSSHTPHAMFLLGDLYYEESEEAKMSDITYEESLSDLRANKFISQIGPQTYPPETQQPPPQLPTLNPNDHPPSLRQSLVFDSIE